MYREILLPVDLDNEATWKKAITAAVALCQAFGANLHVMTVVPDFGMSIVSQYFPKDFEKKALATARTGLQAFAGQHVPGDVKVQHIVAHGTIYEEVLNTARKIKADLIVMGSHRPELQDYLLGPNAARVVRHAPVSVLVVRD